MRPSIVFPRLISAGLKESRSAPGGSDPSDDEDPLGQSASKPGRCHRTAPQLHAAFLNSIPPEAPSEESWQRFMESVDHEVSWDPDSAAPLALRPLDSFKLETRGITKQIADIQPPVSSADSAVLPSASQAGLAPNHESLVMPADGFPEPVVKNRQQELWRRQTIHKFTVAAKLREVGMLEEAQKLESCHSRYVVAICGDCGTVKKFPNRCDQGHCPECQSHLARERVKQVDWWAQGIKQPKHVVLTLRNISCLTRGHLAEARSYLTALRRSAFATKTTYWWQDRTTLKITRCKKLRAPSARGWPLQSAPWRGGFYSMEITKEGKGWHLHFHLLVDCNFISQRVLGDRWRHITRGFSHIVKVLDCREGSYLKEVTKYAVKGSQLAAWEPAAIAQFIKAFSGSRTFGVFGSLYGARSEFADFIASFKGAVTRCECGSCNVRYLDELLYLAEQCTPGRLAPCRPPPPAEHHREFWPEPAHRHD